MQTTDIASPRAAGAAMPPQALERLLTQLTQRIDEVVEEENASLANGGPADVADLIERKSNLLLELLRLTQHVAAWQPDAALREKLEQTQRNLAGNASQLRRHISAIEEVTNVLLQVHDAVESDGLYSRMTHVKGRPR